jgi:hypothetical protein
VARFVARNAINRTLCGGEQCGVRGQWSIESIVDLVGIGLGMNGGLLLPLMPATELVWLLFAQVVSLCFWL